MTVYNDLKGICDFAVHTPIYKLRNLSAKLEMDNIYVKRDDLNEFYGNKTRHAKFLFAWIIKNGYDGISISGRGDSNCMRIYGMAAKRMGIGLSYNFLSRYLGGNGTIMMQLKRKECKNHYSMTFEEQKAIASLGYVEAAEEIDKQFPNLQYIYLYSYEASCVGLRTGFAMREKFPKIVAVRPNSAPHGSLGSPSDCAYFNCIVKQVDEMVGYKTDTLENLERRAVEPFPKSVEFMLNIEGLLIDNNYNARALSALIEDIARKKIPKDANVLLMHTGGIFSGL